jgi:signal transduction histidine kinase
MRLDMVRVSVREVVRAVADLYEILADEKNISMDVNLPHELFINADRTRFQQVIANLVDNAVKYSGDRGRVLLSACEKEGDVLISVSDEGMGIPSEEIGRIWDRLYRGDRSRSRRGLGLGLSFVKAIVQAHDGEVVVESQSNKGSTFTIRLPVAG